MFPVVLTSMVVAFLGTLLLLCLCKVAGDADDAADQLEKDLRESRGEN